MREKTTHNSDVDILRSYCNADTSELMASGEVTKTENGLSYSFIDRGSNVLAVAHCDSVQSSKKFNCEGYRRRVNSPRLDDRLGVYTVMDLLPSVGVPVDVLLTDGEESGKSTAKYFTPSKQYNWAVEFDRRGTDVVVYDTNEKLKDILRKFFDVGFGSYSDIYELAKHKIPSFNVGVGYHAAHSEFAYFDIDDYKKMLRLFQRFFHEYKDTALPVGTQRKRRESWTCGYSGRSNVTWIKEKSGVWTQVTTEATPPIGLSWYSKEEDSFVYCCMNCHKWFFRKDATYTQEVYGYTVCTHCGDWIAIDADDDDVYGGKRKKKKKKKRATTYVVGSGKKNVARSHSTACLCKACVSKKEKKAVTTKKKKKTAHAHLATCICAACVAEGEKKKSTVTIVSKANGNGKKKKFVPFSFGPESASPTVIPTSQNVPAVIATDTKGVGGIKK